jgi:hypothetical protein
MSNSNSRVAAQSVWFCGRGSATGSFTAPLLPVGRWVLCTHSKSCVTTTKVQLRPEETHGLPPATRILLLPRHATLLESVAAQATDLPVGVESYSTTI